MKEVAQRARENLVENIAETNDELLDLYLEGQEILLLNWKKLYALPSGSVIYSPFYVVQE